MKLECIKRDGVDERFVSWAYYPYEGWYEQGSYKTLADAANCFVELWDDEDSYIVYDRIEGVTYDVNKINK